LPTYLELRDPLVSASQVLGLKPCITMPGITYNFIGKVCGIVNTKTNPSNICHV